MPEYGGSFNIVNQKSRWVSVLLPIGAIKSKNALIVTTKKNL